MMRRTVVKKDTASCNSIIHGNSGAKINPDTKMRCISIVNKDNLETIKMRISRVKKDTASCNFDSGNSRAKINSETNIRQSTVVNNNASILTLTVPKDKASNKHTI
jgi:hypothetical protein